MFSDVQSYCNESLQVCFEDSKYQAWSPIGMEVMPPINAKELWSIYSWVDSSNALGLNGIPDTDIDVYKRQELKNCLK